MQAFLKGDHNLDQSLIIDNEAIDLVITGNIKSTKEISIKVRNLIVLAKISNPQMITFEAIQDLYFLGPWIGEGSVCFKSGGKVYTTHTQDVMEKITQLGVKIVLREESRLSLTIPKEATYFDLTSALETIY